MKISGEHHFAATPDRVFGVLTDPARIQRAVDVCQRIEPKGDGVYDVHTAINAFGLRINPVIHVTTQNQLPPASCTFVLAADSQFGNVRSTVNIAISPNSTGTQLHYDGEAAVTGLLASVAPKLVEVTATRALTDFFAKLDAQLAG